MHAESVCAKVFGIHPAVIGSGVDENDRWDCWHRTPTYLRDGSASTQSGMPVYDRNERQRSRTRTRVRDANKMVGKRAVDSIIAACPCSSRGENHPVPRGGFTPPSPGVMARDLSERIEVSIVQHRNMFEKGVKHADHSRFALRPLKDKRLQYQSCADDDEADRKQRRIDSRERPEPSC